MGFVTNQGNSRPWPPQAKVDGVTLRAALQYGGNSSVINGPLLEPGRIPLYVGLPSECGYVDGDCMFFLMYVGADFGECGRHNMDG